jgi:hypothetical protein
MKSDLSTRLRIEVLMVVTMTIADFWDFMPNSLVQSYLHFGGMLIPIYKPCGNKGQKTSTFEDSRLLGCDAIQSGTQLSIFCRDIGTYLQTTWQQRPEDCTHLIQTRLEGVFQMCSS